MEPADRPTCPRCFSHPESDMRCEGCGLEFVTNGRLLDTLGRSQREDRAAEVERFYTKSPFPGYAPADDASSILDRSRRSAFLAELDASIPADARVLDCGCGTAQLAAFLALSGPRRQIFGIDGCRESLNHAEEFRGRTNIGNLQLVRADLFDLPVAPLSMDLVVCRGVVHHTPDPYDAIERVARCVAIDGHLVLGFYETRGRLFHRMRRGLSRVTGSPIRILDPILRRRDVDAEKKRVWTEDQYRHPLEHILPLPRVIATLDRIGFSWVRTVPPVTQRRAMFEPTPRAGSFGMLAVRTGWMLRGLRDPDAGLVCYVARRVSDGCS